MSLPGQPSKRVKVHRLTYACSSGMPVKGLGSVLHMCHRPYCVQPAHLYEGNPHDNRVDAGDRKRLIPKDGWSSITQHFDRGGDRAQYLLPAPLPPNLPAGMTMPPPSEVPPHNHVGEAPAGDSTNLQHVQPCCINDRFRDHQEVYHSIWRPRTYIVRAEHPNILNRLGCIQSARLVELLVSGTLVLHFPLLPLSPVGAVRGVCFISPLNKPNWLFLTIVMGTVGTDISRKK